MVGCEEDGECVLEEGERLLAAVHIEILPALPRDDVLC